MQAPPGWRLLLGAELAEHNPDAAVGVQRPDPALVALVVPERVGSGHVQELRAFLRTQSVPMEGGMRLPLRFLKGTLELVQIKPEGLPDAIRVFHATHFRQEFVFGIPASEDAGQHLQAALDGFGFLGDGARQALERELSALPDGRAMVTERQALWGRHFHDFERGILWTKPSVEWDASIGDARRSTPMGPSSASSTRARASWATCCRWTR